MVNHSLAGSRPAGLEGTRQFLTAARADFRTDQWKHVEVVAENDLVVQFGVREGFWSGTDVRGFRVPAGSYTRDAAFMYRVAGGRIAERWAVNDHLGMLLQLGAIKP